MGGSSLCICLRVYLQSLTASAHASGSEELLVKSRDKQKMLASLEAQLAVLQQVSIYS